MKKMMFMAMMMVMTVSANAMSYNAAKYEALFLSDKMAYELNLTNAQYNAVYEINLDYLMSVNGRHDVFGIWWDRRNTDLKYVLTAWQYEKYMDKTYFYRPLTWTNGSWTFTVYSHYSNKNHFYKAHPKAFKSYLGGNNRKADRFYADMKVNKPTTAPNVKNGGVKPNGNPGKTFGKGSNGKNTIGNAPATGKNSFGNGSANGKNSFGNVPATGKNNKGNVTPANNGNNKQVALNTNKSNSAGHFGGRR